MAIVLKVNIRSDGCLNHMNKDRKPSNVKLLLLTEYDNIIVSFSGGKDSIACVLSLLDSVPTGVREKIELWHQDVDGDSDDNEGSFMDWPCTSSYCSAFAHAFDLPLLFQWRHGGFEREMLRENEQAQPITFEDLDGLGTQTLESTRSKFSTRRKFPQVSGDLSVRWCSSALKIDVATKAINNIPRLKEAKILFITGERGEESPQRAKYASVEKHKSDTQKRTVHQWRPIQDWTEQQVWTMMKKYKVNPHPAYHMGFGRVSCAACIFGNPDQWATVREILPKPFERIANYEQEFGTTIHRSLTVIERADAGEVYTYTEEAKKLAMTNAYPFTELLVDDWQLPAGAFKRCGGPS